MRKLSRVTAALLGLSLTLTACSGQSSSMLPASPDGGSTGSQSAIPVKSDVLAPIHSELSKTPLLTVPRTYGALRFSDEGRRDPKAPVSVTLTLRYNHQEELDRFVAELGSSHGKGRPLSPAQFIARFSPTAAQEEAVVRALRDAGFTITHRFANRTIVDAKAPSAVVERFFHTEMHTVRQGKYGQRFTNVRPGTVPAAIAPIVRDVSLSNVVIARPVVDQGGGIVHPHPDVKNIPATKPAGAASQEAAESFRLHPHACSGQLLLNPGFESGNRNWTTTPGVITNDPYLAYQGSWLAWLDGYTSPETDTLAQTVNIPGGCSATLTYYLWINTSEPSGAVDTLTLTVNGSTKQSFSNANANGGYVKQTVNLSSYAGGSAKIQWTSNQTGSYETDFFVDSTALTLSGGGPTPTPSPTPKPTPTPTPKPTPTPTSGPTPTPTPHPTPTPTTAPTPTPTPSGNCNGTKLSGPLTNSSGTLATGLADPFDYPVQHGCNGSGETAAIVIDDPVNSSYTNTYLSAAGVTHTGTITNEAVDGGGSGDDAETDLDVQTIAGLAPAANIIVYDIGSLADQNIEDAYNQVLSDGKAFAVNSSFGGCESSDTPFADSTNSIAQQGAATGVEFSASSGDSGSDECSTGNNPPGVSAPAGGPYFLSIGGVNFTEQTTPLTSVTMGSASGYSGGGGVSSGVFALPSYQSGITGMITSGRNQPDVSLPFDPVAVYTGGAWGQYLGTSWSSPASVALLLEADQYHGSHLGWVNSTIYSLFSGHGYGTYFIPCTSGNNGSYSCTSSHYNQAAG
ncbi:MAG: hypothetical protein JOY98_15650, partial [Candidatus Eremiobacteraeota bacterium]|nr:hypothetical protein [Candidatus Eremiobacteraeota bacterium]